MFALQCRLQPTLYAYKGRVQRGEGACGAVVVQVVVVGGRDMVGGWWCGDGGDVCAQCLCVH